MDGNKVLDGVMGGGLRALNKVASSPLIERLGLEKQAQQLVYEGAKRAAIAAAKAAKRVSGKPAGKRARPKLRFDFRLTDEQELMRETLRRFANDLIREAAREADDRGAPPSHFIEAFHELGAVMLAVPESMGGAAERSSPVSHMLIAEDLAWGDMGLAYAALAPLSFVHALVLWGDDAQRGRYLVRFTGEQLPSASLAMAEPHPMFDPRALRTTATKRGSTFVLDGDKSMVALANQATCFLVSAQLGRSGPRLFIVDRDQPGVSTEEQPTMGLRSAGLGRVRLKNVKVSAEAMLGGPESQKESGQRIYRDATNRARVAWGALALGTGQAVLDYVIPYCNEREAFGEPISHRQAVAFMIADTAIELESMRMLVYRAAGRLEQGLPCDREAYLAHVLCAEKAMKIGTQGVQLLGGAGFIKDHPIEIWYRHLRAIGVMEGNVLV